MSLSEYAFFQLLNSLAFFGCIWFVLTRIIFGPLTTLWSSKKPVVDIDSGEIVD